MTDLESSNLVVWPKWCYSNNHMESEANDLVSNNNNSTNFNNNHRTLTSALKEKYLSECGVRRKKQRHTQKDSAVTNGMPTDTQEDVKKERVSPEPENSTVPSSESSQITHHSPTPSTSPKSPASLRARTPSFPGTPPNPTFTPPTSSIHQAYDRFSPAGIAASMGALPTAHGGAMKQMESLMSRNCSDLMRSLAAKYNNSAPNDYFSNPTHSSLRSPINPLSPYSKANQYIGVTPPTCRDVDKKISDPSVSVAASCLPPGIPVTASPMFGGQAIPGFPNFPLVDMSSTHVLLNMVRNASAAQQSQLENYLRGAMKRPADGPASPLDLSASVGAKRPRTDMGPKAFDVKTLFSLPDEKCETKVQSPPLVKPRPCSPPVKTFLCSDQSCSSADTISMWTVDEVYSFVKSIDLCAEYAEAFKDQRIDGSALPLLTEEHLTTSINMKLGPALKLKSVLARKLGVCNICLHCTHCHTPPTERRPSSASNQ